MDQKNDGALVNFNNHDDTGIVCQGDESSSDDGDHIYMDQDLLQDCSSPKKEKRVDKAGRVRPRKYAKGWHKKEILTEKPVIDKDSIAYSAISQTSDFSDHEKSKDYDSSQLEQQSVALEKSNENLRALGEDTEYDQTNNKLDNITEFDKLVCEILEDNTCSGLVNEDGSDDDLISDEKWQDLMQVEEENDSEQEESNDLPDKGNDQKNNSNETFKSNVPIYPGHHMTVHNSMVLILLYSICHSVSGAQLADTLTLISIHCLQSHAGLQSIYMFKKYFANMHSPIMKHFFCRNCMSNVDEFEETCSSCGKMLTGLKKKDYFIELPLEEQLKKILQRPGILSLIQTRFSKKKKKENGIEDIYDGNIYKKMSSPGGVLSEKNPNNISLTWNTDGIPVFKSSKFSLWPFYLVINEIPYKQRMMKENMILCGLWFGESKPFISLFTKPLMKSLKNLESNGINYEIGDCKVVTKAFLICGTADLPAKSLVLNCNQFNGRYSCMRCVHPGETYKTTKGGCVHVFPYDASKTPYEERTPSNCLKDAVIATESRKTTNGIKGPSFLMTLKSYDFVKSSSIDYMHGVLLGIGKLLIKLWIGGSYSKERFSIASYVDIIDERLLNIKPPSVITRAPRSLSGHFKYWKASEIRSWIQFYSLPILCDILPEEYFMHFACFVQGIYLLSSDSVSPKDLQKSQSLLSYFVHMFPSLYGERYVTLNMHSLLHLTQCVQDLGPLWVYSCFPFENINGVLMELFHGTQNIELQIMYSINVVQNMSLMAKDIKDENLIHFADKMNHKQNSTKAIIGTSSASFPIGASSNILLSDTLFGKLVNEVKFVPAKILSYKRISLRGTTLHSTAYTRVQVRNTYTVKYYNLVQKQFSYGCIAHYILAKKCECVQEICLCNSALIAVIQELKCTGHSIINPNFLGVNVPHINIVQKTDNVHLVDVTKILNVVVFIDILGDEGKQFVCDFPNVKESD